MPKRFGRVMIAVAIVSAAVGAILGTFAARPAGQQLRPARTSDGGPNFSGVWQANNEAN